MIDNITELAALYLRITGIKPAAKKFEGIGEILF